MTDKLDIPWDLYHVISTLLTRFISIESDSGLRVQELYLLAHIKEFGKPYGDSDGRIILRREATKLLGSVFDYSDKQVSDALKNLREVGCITEYDLTLNEKRNIYGKPDGRLAAVIVMPEGYRKLEEFTVKLHEIYLDLTASVPQIVLRPVSHVLKAKPILKSIADWLLNQKKELEGRRR